MAKWLLALLLNNPTRTAFSVIMGWRITKNLVPTVKNTPVVNRRKTVGIPQRISPSELVKDDRLPKKFSEKDMLLKPPIVPCVY